MSTFYKSSVCPSCASHEYYKSRRKGLLEHILHALFFVSPFRCTACDERYFRFRFLTPPHANKQHHHVT
jgi:hypothetical protein